MTRKSASSRLLNARFRFKLWSITTIQCDIVEKDAFYEQLRAVQRKLPKGDIVIVIGDLNAKVGSDSLLGHVMGKHGLGGGLWISAAATALSFINNVPLRCSNTEPAKGSVGFHLIDT